MSEWDDLQFDSSDEATPKQAFQWPLWAGIAALAFLIGFFLWFFVFRGSGTSPEPAPVAESGTTPEVSEVEPVEPEPEETMDLPLLDESDALVRTLVGALSSRPELAQWLTNEELIRTFVVVVDNVAEGVSPARHLPFLEPKEKFKAVYDAGSFYVNPRSYDRYNLVADIVSSINVRRGAEFYRNLKPLIQEAYKEMGYPDTDFDVTFSRAIDHLLMTPVPDGYAELNGETVAYSYVDERFEKLSSAQKQLLRMGPQNVQKVQSLLTELKISLNLATAP
jgi:hypothetical protein